MGEKKGATTARKKRHTLIARDGAAVRGGGKWKVSIRVENMFPDLPFPLSFRN
jgi:hypothetical protein